MSLELTTFALSARRSTAWPGLGEKGGKGKKGKGREKKGKRGEKREKITKSAREIEEKGAQKLAIFFWWIGEGKLHNLQKVNIMFGSVSSFASLHSLFSMLPTLSFLFQMSPELMSHLRRDTKFCLSVLTHGGSGHQAFGRWLSIVVYTRGIDASRRQPFPEKKSM